MKRWLVIIEYLKSEKWLHKNYSSKDEWAILTDKNGDRYLITSKVDLEGVKELVNAIKNTYGIHT